MLERTQQFGNLKVLGAGSGYFCLLLLTETLLICVPGTVAGIFLTLLIRWGMQVTFPNFLKLDLIFAWWAIALSTVATVSRIGRE